MRALLIVSVGKEKQRGGGGGRNRYEWLAVTEQGMWHQYQSVHVGDLVSIVIVSMFEGSYPPKLRITSECMCTYTVVDNKTFPFRCSSTINETSRFHSLFFVVCTRNYTNYRNYGIHEDKKIITLHFTCNLAHLRLPFLHVCMHTCTHELIVSTHWWPVCAVWLVDQLWNGSTSLY